MKITMYDLITLIKNKKMPKKIKINEEILNLEVDKETLYRYESHYGSLCFDYYIETNKLDYEIEILDKDFKLEEKKIEYIDLSERIGETLCISPNEEKIQNKFNEIIDYLESKGDE